eukprot:6188067-Pleurochrysis_carterae.AAC.8
MRSSHFRRARSRVVPPASAHALAACGRVQLEDLLAFVDEHAGCGLIYATKRAECERLSDVLTDGGVDDVCAYHAGKSAETRSKLLRDFLGGDVRIMVATIAFGMGVNKSDIRWVVRRTDCACKRTQQMQHPCNCC